MNKLWAIAGAVALLIGTYYAGHSAGYARGNTAGIHIGQTSRDLEVAGLKENVTTLAGTIKLEREAQAKKIAEVQTQAADDAIQTQQFLAQQVRQRDQVIQRYKDTVPMTTQTHCALSVETVRAINQLIDHEPPRNSVDPAALDPTSAATGSTVGELK